MVKGLVTMLNNHPGVDQKLPRGAALDGYSDIGIEIGMLVRAGFMRAGFMRAGLWGACRGRLCCLMSCRFPLALPLKPQ